MTVKNPPKSIIVIVGPTASGKTGLGIQLAKKFHGEIISADSRQVYVGLDIGTGKEGKPSFVELDKIGRQPVRIIDGIPQYLIDLLPPHKIFTVADFQAQAEALINNILSRGKVPIIVGGTHFYISALMQGFQLPPTSPKEQQWRHRLEKLDANTILERLRKEDPKSFAAIDHQNRRRLIRALAVTLATKQSFSQQLKKTSPAYHVLYLGVDLPREKLYQLIDQRVDARFETGMLKEVKTLLKLGITPERLISLGLEYRYITLYLTGQIKSYDEMVMKLKYAIHAFARRQLTWLRHQLPVTWVKSQKEAVSLVQKFLNQ